MRVGSKKLDKLSGSFETCSQDNHGKFSHIAWSESRFFISCSGCKAELILILQFCGCASYIRWWKMYFQCIISIAIDGHTQRDKCLINMSHHQSAMAMTGTQTGTQNCWTRHATWKLPKKKHPSLMQCWVQCQSLGTRSRMRQNQNDQNGSSSWTLPGRPMLAELPKRHRVATKK